MSSAADFRPHYTIDDYRHWKGDWELWEGHPIAMSPSPFGQHAAIVSRLVRHLGNGIDAAGCHAIALPEIDWIVSDDTVVRPDLVVVCGDPPERHVETPPALVAEVLSPSTAQNDRTFKRRLYRDQRVPTYLIIDGETRTVTIDRTTPAGETQTETAGETIDITLCEDCEIQIISTNLFG